MIHLRHRREHLHPVNFPKHIQIYASEKQHFSTAPSVILSGMNSYIIDLTLRSFNEANQFCQKTYNSSLATIYTPEQNDEAIELCLSNDGYACWIGLHQNYTLYGDNKFHWVENGVVASFYGFEEPEPNNYDGNENCTEIICHTCSFDSGPAYGWIYGGAWVDEGCDEPQYTICNNPQYQGSVLSEFWVFNLLSKFVHSTSGYI